MKISGFSSFAHYVLGLALWTTVRSQTITSNLAANARTINDLQHVLGPNFRLFVAGYWRYLLASCDIFQARINKDVELNITKKYCNYLTICPQVSPTQSCLIQVSAIAVRLSCCPTPFMGLSFDNVTTSPSQPPTAPTSPSAIPTTFSLQASQSCSFGQVLPTGRIYGGVLTRRGEFPWIAMLLRNGTPICSSTILDTTHLMTAAHCFEVNADRNMYEIIAGKYRYNVSQPEDGEQRIRVDSFMRHRQFDSRTTWNDIALLELAHPLVWTRYVQPACLPSAGDSLVETCTVAGWGKIEGNENPDQLMKTDLQTYTDDECLEEFGSTAQRALQPYLFDGVLCAANSQEGLRDACGGDSGSPLMCLKRTASSTAYFVFGIVSNGEGCAVPGEPGIYVNIAYYLTWIQDTIASF